MWFPFVSCILVVFLQSHCIHARMKNHFPARNCRNIHSLRLRKTTFRHTSWPERIFNANNNGRAGHGNTMKNISKTKGRHRASFVSYCLERVDNKGQPAIKTKECERQNERKWRVRQIVNTKKYIWENKKLWAWIQWKSLRLAKESRWEKAAWNKRKSIRRQRKPRRKTKQSRCRRPRTSARNGSQSEGDRHRQEYKTNPVVWKKFELWGFKITDLKSINGKLKGETV